MTRDRCAVGDGDCGEKTFDGRYVINICEWYWREGLGSSTPVGTLIHESSHHFGTFTVKLRMLLGTYIGTGALILAIPSNVKTTVWR